MKIAIIVTAFAMIAMSCQNNSKSKTQELKTQEIKMEQNNKSSMGDELMARSKASALKFSDEKRKVYAEGIEAVANSGVLDNALKIGDKAVDFSLKNSSGEVVSLYNELKNGPIVLTWYRGGWCPYCNINLHFLQERLPDFKSTGATLFALTPELPDNSLSTSEKHSLEFEVLSDVGNVVGRSYGLIYQLTDDVAENYDKAFDMNGYNGDESNELPLSATYVIAQDGIITFAFLDADYKKRAEPDDILIALKKLKNE